MQVTENTIKKFVIVGGGTAGWVAAATLGNIFKDSDVTVELVESPDVAIIGVGEATIPPFLETIRSLGIDEAEFIKATQASFKWGIRFENWHKKDHAYFHPFGSLGRDIDGHEFYQCWLKSKAEGDETPLMAHSPESVLSDHNRFFLPFKAMGTPLASAHYALHLDAVLVGRYLRDFAKSIGVIRTEGHVEAVIKNEQGFINSVTLKDGREVNGDFFIDCTGFKGLLIEEALQTGYDDWSHYLPCNRAVTVQTKNIGETTPYTTSRAQNAGWTWRIPLQHRTGNGYVFCDKYCSDEDAIATLLANIEGEPITTPKVIPFVTGIRKQAWNKNCLALGLAQGFLEPLESTAIHLVSKTLAFFVRLFPTKECNPILMSEFNRRVKADYEEIRDFLVLHYSATERDDTEFWRWCQNMEIPATLQKKLDFFKVSGGLIPGVEELFQPTSWYAVLDGMGITPKNYNPTLDALNYSQLNKSLTSGKQAIEQVVKLQPSHDEFIQQYCRAPIP
ncbi:tryptophan 7-halogenase [Colwellia sp. D2M02]|uniref:tryptophan halogenase family protein n=1 Tax=Colwellia sp. D2M02 TaxID=2841562 RepID=UPI001C089B33|nr:tryptophan halogenase family protein [Colwellia sp. D2M02]MBU2893308.1 tryptophan 7-halogenase [Colwellia sp. D2M02]